MRKHLLLLLAALLPMVANAYTYNVYDAEIDGIYYNFLGNEATVTYQKYQDSSPYYISDYTGAVVIPSSVTYNSKTYSVTSIGRGAFYGCSGLTSITIPNSVTSIDYAAFKGCSSLTSVTIPESVTSIGNEAFCDCSGLTSITIGNGVTSIGSNAFENCTSLTSITIPNSVTRIAYAAFKGCSSLTSITIPNSVTSIGSQAFYGTGWYKAQPNGILYLDNWLIGYKETKPTGNVAINSGTRGIAESAFYGCSGLTSVTIPNSVTSIGYLAFYDCSGLTSVTIPNSVTSIGGYAFYGCSGLTSVTLNSNAIVSASGDSEGLSRFPYIFGSQVKEYVLGDAVTNIPDYAFSGCSGLTSITIPNSVTSIGDYAFEGCTSLEEIYCHAEQTPTVYDDAFKDVDVSNVTLYVPRNSYQQYKEHPIWGKFDIAIGTGIKSLTPTLSEGEEEWFDLSGRKLDKPQRGINIIRFSDGTTKKVKN